MDSPETVPSPGPILLPADEIRRQEARQRKLDGQREGGRNKVQSGRKHSQKRGSIETPSGGSWLRLKDDWLTGAFGLNDLAQMYGVSRKTIEYRMKKEEWGERPTAPLVARILPGLMDSVADGAIPTSETVEAIIAMAEGREIDPDAVALEKAGGTAKRKAGILRDHREMATTYRTLFRKGAEYLERYASGEASVSFVKGKTPDGKEIYSSFLLFSRQHGFLDAVDRVGLILERVIKLERQTYGLEDVDGDGKKRSGPVGPGSGFQTLSDEELRQKHDELMRSLASPSRVTPLPGVLASDVP